MNKRSNKGIAIIVLISVVLILINYQTNHFSFLWCIYPIIIGLGISIIMKYVK
jgi:hypothetical protein